MVSHVKMTGIYQLSDSHKHITVCCCITNTEDEQFMILHQPQNNSVMLWLLSKAKPNPRWKKYVQ